MKHPFLPVFSTDSLQQNIKKFMYFCMARPISCICRMQNMECVLSCSCRVSSCSQLNRSNRQVLHKLLEQVEVRGKWGPKTCPRFSNPLSLAVSRQGAANEPGAIPKHDSESPQCGAVERHLWVGVFSGVTPFTNMVSRT